MFHFEISKEGYEILKNRIIYQESNDRMGLDIDINCLPSALCPDDDTFTNCQFNFSIYCWIPCLYEPGNSSYPENVYFTQERLPNGNILLTRITEESLLLQWLNEMNDDSCLIQRTTTKCVVRYVCNKLIY